MKFSVSSSALLSLLATTGKVISNKNTLPILDYFLMELKGDQLKVTTSDLETTLVGADHRRQRRERRDDRRPRQAAARLAQRVRRNSADDRLQRPDFRDQTQLEKRFAFDSRRQRRELSGAARARGGQEGADVRRRHARKRYQQDDLRHGRRRTASDHERRLHQHRARVDHVRGHRRPQVGEVLLRSSRAS